jgi:hypothetical protein
MSYTPLNTLVFQAAFQGALAGMGAGGLANGLAPTSLASFSSVASDALQYAEEVDTLWAGASASSTEVAGIQAASQIALENRTPNQAITAAALVNLATSAIAMVQEGDAVLAAAGITPAQSGSNIQFGNNLTPTAPTIDGTVRFVMAATAIAKKSGIFRVSASLALLGVTAGDTWEAEVLTQTEASAFTLTNASQAGPGTTGGAYISSAAAGIGVTGGPFGQITQSISSNQTNPTGASTAYWSWSGPVMNANSGLVFVPFPVGNHVLALIGLAISAGALTALSGNVSLEEI